MFSDTAYIKVLMINCQMQNCSHTSKHRALIESKCMKYGAIQNTGWKYRGKNKVSPMANVAGGMPLSFALDGGTQNETWTAIPIEDYVGLTAMFKR